MVKLLGLICLWLLLPQSDAIDGWILDLSQKDIRMRENAVERLVAAGLEAAPRVMKLLDRPDPELVLRAREILDRQEPVFEVASEVDSTDRFALSPDGKRIAFYSRALKLSVLSIDGLDLQWAKDVLGPPPGQRPRPLWTSRHLVAGMARGSCSRFDPATGDELASWSLSKDAIELIQVLDPGDVLFHCDGQLRIYLPDKKYSAELPGSRTGVSHPSGSIILGLLNSQLAWKREGIGELLGYAKYGDWKCKDLGPMKSRLHRIVASADFSCVFATIDGKDDAVEIDPVTYEVRPVEWGVLPQPTCLYARSGGAWRLTGDSEGTVRVFDRSWRCIAKLSGTAAVTHVEASADGNVLAFSDGQKIRILRRKWSR